MVRRIRIAPVLTRDAMQSAVYAVARCLSVYLSATRRYSVETATPILKLFDSSHIILVFKNTKWQYSDEDSLRRLRMQRGINKNLAIANRSRVSCAHNMLGASMITL